MSHYQFDRMGSAQFEHMVQALAKAELGNGVKAFGSGPDGQRDATFSGKVNFPVGSEGGKWSGYGVIQVKYNERPKDTTADTRWFLGEIRKELSNWALKNASGKRTPKYFLAVTNVVLSGVDEFGGKDRFDQMMQAFADQIGLVGWFAWDDTELRTLLDQHTDIRQRYLELITVGDFLADIELLAPTVALTAKRLAVNAAAEIATKQWVRTGDNGFADSSKLRLADIAIDLPAVRMGRGTRSNERFLGARWAMEAGDIVKNQAHGVVFIGGPGQGKSTLSQLIAHAYRIEFVAKAGAQQYGEKAGQASEALRDRLREAGIPIPKRRRWPVFVDLAKMAGAASIEQDSFSLLGYLAQTLIVDGKETDPQELLGWMRSWPVCLILDGLDEVADPKARIRVSKAVTQFVTEASAYEIDLFIVATTRPQGYHDEFPELFPAQSSRLVPFTETEAIDYSDALVKVRNVDDPDLAAQVTERLITAVHERVTQRLMTTPLQVTIMTALAERSVDLPTDRYELFDEYYKVVYDREIGKDGSFAGLKKLRPHINHLHESAGLQLHRRAEKGSDSAAFLSSHEISRILVNRLKTAGYEEWRAKKTADDVLRLSTERLVMLVVVPRERYEFEVRSLQEYMAARSLTDGSDDEVIRRLKILLPSAHWRNIWLLAAGRVLKDRERIAGDLFQIVADYDHASVENGLTLLGGALASDLLQDDIALEFPVFLRQLQTAALAQMSRIENKVPENLTGIITAAMKEGGARQTEALTQLATISEKSLSNLASRFLSQNKSGMSPLAKQARVTLGAGRNYIKPNATPIGRLFDVPVRQVAEMLQASSDLQVQALAAALKRGPGENVARSEAKLLDALAHENARNEVARAAAKLRHSNLTETRAVAQMLSYSATRTRREQELGTI
jgi:hypothetical protein